MLTELTDDPVKAAQFIRKGEIVAFPTETVYGLGADARNPVSVSKIFAAKGRPTDNPLIVHIADKLQLLEVARELPPFAEALAERFMPGPLTLVLFRRRIIPDIVTAGLDTVGVRCPQHPLAQEFLRAAACPVAAPSANRSGRPSPTTWRAVLTELEGLLPCVLKGEQSHFGLESTVVDCTGEMPLVLRAGAVTLEQLCQVVPSTRLAECNAKVRSPGMKYRHYCPRVNVVLVNSPQEIPMELSTRSAYIGLVTPKLPLQKTVVCEGLEDYARQLFEFFRECEMANVEQIFCQTVEDRGLGLALMDRLRRAAAML
ncbi:MAG: L-threonylcarbamoyladenylate synthase [Acidobacteriota bacterium]|nr:L-threonylcarbamoyladenylate synthase [Blastocatellia bacterium]MDW8412785.1 L-threonylcarbamoyladenylate synthase [Acidobacteriota bacterium]